MDKNKIVEFLLKARTQTYAAAAGKVESALPGSIQYEYREENFLYRDVYNIGNGIFMGIETINLNDKPVISMSYFGNFKQITEDEADSVLRKALIDNWDKARLWHHVKWEKENYVYVCEPDKAGNIDEFSGSESITKDGKQVYYFYYAGGFIG